MSLQKILNESLHIQPVCRILRFNPPQIPTCLTWNIQIWPISKKKSCWTFKPKTTELFFPWVFSLAPSQSWNTRLIWHCWIRFSARNELCPPPSRRRWGIVVVVSFRCEENPFDVCETRPFSFFKGGKDGGIRGVKVFVCLWCVCAQIFHEDGTSIRSGNMNQTTLKYF